MRLALTTTPTSTTASSATPTAAATAADSPTLVGAITHQVTEEATLVAPLGRSGGYRAIQCGVLVSTNLSPDFVIIEAAQGLLSPIVGVLVLKVESDEEDRIIGPDSLRAIFTRSMTEWSATAASRLLSGVSIGLIREK